MTRPASRIPRWPALDVRNRTSRPSRGRQSRQERGSLALVVAAVITSYGCATTHQLGPATDGATLEELGRVVEQPGTVARVEPLPGAGPSAPALPIESVGPEGVTLHTVARPTVVPLAEVRSISTYSRGRGARDGALIAGIPTFVVTAVLTALLLSAIDRSIESDGGDTPSTQKQALVVLGVSTGVGLAGALVGAGVGALAGHEDRYIVARD
jgi:hypothetical protein